MEDSWLQFAKRLSAIATTGLEFTREQYDRERYEEILEISQHMLASLGSVPLARIHELIATHEVGYVTPKVDVRAAVFQGERILLVKEASDGLWTLPGGYADVGLSAAENVEKEVQEEAGLTVKATELYAVRHKAKGEYDPDVRDFYKLFFLCNAEPDATPTPGPETSDARFFSQQKLPPLSTGRVVVSDLQRAWDFLRDPGRGVLFD